LNTQIVDEIEVLKDEPGVLFTQANQIVLGAAGYLSCVEEILTRIRRIDHADYI